MPSAVKTSAEITAVMDKVFVYYKRDYQYQSNKKTRTVKIVPLNTHLQSH